jgi:hypothetical protein
MQVCRDAEKVARMPAMGMQEKPNISMCKMPLPATIYLMCGGYF